MISKKISLIGDFCVGKTSLIRSFVEQQFSDQYLSTVGVKISRKVVDIDSLETSTSQSVQLLIWDIEGRTEFQAIAPTYLQGTHGAIIVADVSRPETIEHLQEHIALVAKVNSRRIPLIVALNKSDLLSQGDETEKIDFPLPLFSDYPQVITTYMTSAKTGHNVEALFQKLTQNLLVKS